MKFYRAFLFVALVLLSATARAQEWAAYGTISAEPTAGRICTGDANGKDILCASPAPYVDASGNVGIGTATPGGTLHVYAPSTQTAADAYGFYLTGAQSTANTTAYYGAYLNPTYTAATGNTLATFYGLASNPLNSSSGQVNNLQGLRGTPQNTSTGTVTNIDAVVAVSVKSGTGAVTSMKGLYSQCQNTNVTGVVTNCYGLYLATPITTGPITNKYGVYQQDSNSTNYFAGNVGIGTTSPASLFHVYKSSTLQGWRFDSSLYNWQEYYNTEANPRVEMGTNVLPGALAGIGFRSSGTSIAGSGAAVGSPSLQILGLYTSNGSTLTERMRIDGTGNVGIGTATPATTALLDVFSTTKGFLPPRMTTAQRDAISAPAAGLTVYNATTNALNLYTGSSWTSLGDGLATNFAAGSVSAPGLYVTGDANTGLYQATADTLSITAGGVEAARFNTAASGVNYFNFTPSATGSVLNMSAAGTDTNIGIRLTPKGIGSVGIGVNPSGLAQLEVTSSSIASGIYISQVRTTGTNVALNARAGGSGATTNIAGYFAPDGASNNYAILIPLNYPPAGTNNYAIRSESTAQSHFAGNVGIGTTAPAEKLEVSGNIKASGTLQVANSAATCTGAADYGKFRYNPVNGKLQICKP